MTLEEFKQMVKDSVLYKELEAQLSSKEQEIDKTNDILIELRAENEKLKELLSETEAVQDKTALILKTQSIERLRKRCEDLEALSREASYYITRSQNVSLCADIDKLLSQ